MDLTNINTVVGIVGAIIGVIGIVVTVISFVRKKTITISTKTKLYVNPGDKGAFVFDYSNNNGFYTIGSGETAIAATQFFLDRKIPTNNLFVLGLVAMQQGVDCLTQNSIHVFSGRIMQKAISERSDGKKDTYCELMKAIEVKIKVRDEYKFGYAQSEGLVKMMRTPNNTFPIYWLKNKKNQKIICIT